jgi:hypothetical protein
LVYTTVDGEVIKKFRKGWERNDDGCLDRVMLDVTSNPHRLSGTTTVEEPEEETAE